MTDPEELDDEFGPYLEDAMRDEEFRAAYEHASREPTPVEQALERSGWTRFYWRWLRTRAALADRIAYEYEFTRGGHERPLLPATTARAAAESWKAGCPW